MKGIEFDLQKGSWWIWCTKELLSRAKPVQHRATRASKWMKINKNRSFFSDRDPWSTCSLIAAPSRESSTNERTKVAALFTDEVLIQFPRFRFRRVATAMTNQPPCTNQLPFDRLSIGSLSFFRRPFGGQPSSLSRESSSRVLDFSAKVSVAPFRYHADQ